MGPETICQARGFGPVKMPTLSSNEYILVAKYPPFSYDQLPFRFEKV